MKKIILPTSLFVGFVGFILASGQKPVLVNEYPKSIVVDQKLVESEGGWESFQQDTAHPVMSVSIFDGHPKEGAALVPDATTPGGKNKSVAVWRLADNKTGRYWLAFTYQGTNIQLTRPIDENFSICEITYDHQVTVGGYPLIMDIRLK